MLPPNFEDVIEIKGERVTEAQIAAFHRAVRAASPGTPPTFPTAFREAEFKFLGRLQADVRNLLHTEQEYTYLQAILPGDILDISTRFIAHRERRGTHFMTLETKISSGGVDKVVATTKFVIREEGSKE